MDLYKFEYKRMKPCEQLPLHRQDSWELTYVVFGRGKCVLGDSEKDFAAGSLAFVPPHIPHGWKFDEDWVDEDGLIGH